MAMVDADPPLDVGAVEIGRHKGNAVVGIGGKRSVLMIAGSFGYGTWAGIQYLQSNEFLKSEVARWKSFEMLIEVDVALISGCRRIRSATASSLPP